MECSEFKIEVERLCNSVSEKLEDILRQFYEPYGLTAPQAMILLTLHRDGPGKISDVAKALQMTNSNLSVICRRLEKSGYLIRKRDDMDQRVVFIYLTDECKSLINNVEKQIRIDYLSPLEQASEEDRATILNGMRKLNELLSQSK